MSASLEQVVRPAQAPAPGVSVPLTKKASTPVLLVILAGTGVKSFTGETSLAVTIYNKKMPKEPTGTGTTTAFSPTTFDIPSFSP